MATFDALSVYKNARAGIYFRGDQAHFTNAVFADNGTSAFFAYNQVIRDSIMVGLSDNHSNSELLYHYDPALDSTIQHRKSFEGIRVYDGPFVLDNVFFANYSETPLFHNNKDITPTPITMTGGASRFVNSVKHLTFAPQPYRKFWMKHDANVWQDSYSAGVLDIEGDLTGTAGAIIRPNHAMNTYVGCNVWVREEALVCSYEMSHLRINVGAYSLQQFNVRRSDGPSFVYDPNDQSAVNLNKFSMIMTDNLAYIMEEVNFKNESQVLLDFTTRDIGDVSPVIGLYSANNIPCALSELALSKGTQVANLNVLRNTTETAYTTQGGKFFFRLQADAIRPNISPESPQGENELSLNCVN